MKEIKSLLDEGIECVPVGSVEFVIEFYEQHIGLKPGSIQPINIPESLMKPAYLNRQVVRHLKDWQGVLPETLFYKETHRFKGLADIYAVEELPSTESALFSEVIEDLESEWRVFVLNGQLIELKVYAGDYRVLPDEDLIQAMIQEIKEYQAYTLDVGVNSKGETFLIEMHQFFSCGLYGMNRTDLLPQFYYRTHLDIMKKSR